MPTQSLSLQGVDAVSGAAPVVNSSGGSSNWGQMLSSFQNFYSQFSTSGGTQTGGVTSSNIGTSTQGASQIIDTVSQQMGNIGGGFGMGYTMGYNGIKTLTEPYLAYRAAKHEKALLGMQADLANMQAMTYQTAAEDIIRAGHQQVAEATYNMGQSIASTRVSQASSGVRVAGSGSTAEVIANQRKVDAKGRALAFRSARSAINPWISAIAAHLTAVNNSAPKMMSGFMQMKGIPAGK